MQRQRKLDSDQDRAKFLALRAAMLLVVAVFGWSWSTSSVVAQVPVRPQPASAANTSGGAAPVLRADPSGLIRAVTLFDVYKPQAPGTGIAQGERSFAVRLELLDFDSTLTEDRIESVVAAAVARVAQAFGARLRA